MWILSWIVDFKSGKLSAFIFNENCDLMTTKIFFILIVLLVCNSVNLPIILSFIKNHKIFQNWNSTCCFYTIAQVFLIMKFSLLKNSDSKILRIILIFHVWKTIRGNIFLFQLKFRRESSKLRKKIRVDRKYVCSLLFPGKTLKRDWIYENGRFAEKYLFPIKSIMLENVCVTFPWILFQFQFDSFLRIFMFDTFNRT